MKSLLDWMGLPKNIRLTDPFCVFTFTSRMSY
jgi:hypothetical protein